VPVARPADTRRRAPARHAKARPAAATAGPRPRPVASSLAAGGAAAPGRICVGAIVGAHGVAGAVRIKSFTTAPADIARYGPVGDEAGTRSFALDIVGVRPDCVIARIAGVADRGAAAALAGTRLYVARARLPANGPEEYYHADLLGMTAERAAGGCLGTVVAVHTIGGGEVLEIARAGGPAAMVPFTRAAVPEVDVAARRLVVAPGFERVS
jgi:16S rRNA processing protein RimM